MVKPPIRKIIFQLGFTKLRQETVRKPRQLLRR